MSLEKDLDTSAKMFFSIARGIILMIWYHYVLFLQYVALRALNSKVFYQICLSAAPSARFKGVSRNQQ
jgi:hypothetical protein